ncbi:hypothetical protein VNO78_04117 [Psophocarpus tetragonolobus]|uniref:Uncharacterized protein n=1 Tax=Psophocarpus tetragonolobus TaxID=3891 RepID=A0AAN9TEG2_PSOTE
MCRGIVRVWGLWVKGGMWGKGLRGGLLMVCLAVVRGRATNGCLTRYGLSRGCAVVALKGAQRVKKGKMRTY